MRFPNLDPALEAFAAREPYFSVLTAPEYRRANLTPEHERTFFATGEELVSWMLGTIELRFDPEFAPMSVLEYGCGVGRLVVPFSRIGASVTAVDRSPAMLEAARQTVTSRSGGAVTFLTPDELFAAPRKFDLVSCVLVLQRMPPPEGLGLMRRLLGLLGSGGIGVLQVPYRASTGRLVSAARALRARVPAVNAAANRLKGRDRDEPIVPTYLYDLDDIARVLKEAEFDSICVMDPQDDLSTATFFVHAPPASTVAVSSDAASTAGHVIDVRRLLADASVGDLNRDAEAYFSSIQDWDHHLAKPFSKPDEAPPLLMDVVTLLQGIQIAPGARVLEFGAGTGWLSRFLTQLGCETVLLDVSPTALRMAEELYHRQPVIGAKPAPTFLVFDGHHIDLPDESVDRVIVFHALHHVPNQRDALAELGRVLKPGGIAGFAEPGPRHSRSPLSQFEMRTYGVIENDVDVFSIWRDARQAGFSQMRLALFHTPPHHVSLEEYEDFLAGGATCAAWVTSTRDFLRHVRTFFLHKSGERACDSRTTSGLACRIDADPSDAAADDRSAAIVAMVTNSGDATWLPSDVPAGGVLLGLHVYDSLGKLVAFDAARQLLTEPPRPVRPGETVRVRLVVPPLPAGQYWLELDCVAEGVTWFAQAGSTPARLEVRIGGPRA